MGDWTSFEEAFIHTDDHRVLGRKLRPFSLYHQLILEAIGSPVMSADRPVTLIDLEIASRVCASDYGGYRSAGRRSGWLGKLWWLARALRADTQKEMLAMDRYFKDYTSVPDRWENGGEVKGSGKAYSEFPAPLSVVGCLMANGFQAGDEKKVWMTPLGAAHWYCATFLRMDGADLKLMTEHDREFIEGFKREQEKQRREQEEGEEPEEDPGEDSVGVD